MEDRVATRTDVATLDAYRCSEVDVLLDSIRAAIEELEADIESAQDRRAAALAWPTDSSSIEQHLGRKLLMAECELASIHSRAEVEAARIVREAEARASEITERGDAATRQLLELANELVADPDSEPPHTPPEAPRSDEFDDPVVGPASTPLT